MDKATILGIITGVFLLGWAMAEGGDWQIFWNPASLAITLGGTFAAILISYPMHRLLSMMKVLKNAFFKRKKDPAEVINMMVGFAEKARKEGLLALEEEANEVDDDFTKQGIQLVVDGTDPELVKGILDTELTYLEERHRAGAGIFQTMGNLAPSFGMIGTLIGLIKMLQHLDDPDAIGPGLAVALLTTFYGALIANLIFLPIAGKLRYYSSEEILEKEIIMEGVLSIQAGDNPRVVQEKLKAFLPPTERHNVGKKKETDMFDEGVAG